MALILLKNWGQVVFDTFYRTFLQSKINVAAQCCEQLNRALIVSHQIHPLSEPVNVVPFPKAGGAFATCLSTIS